MTWKDSSGTSEAIRARLFNANGSPAAADFVVQSFPDDFVETPNITALTDGRFVVTWVSYDEDDYYADYTETEIRAKIFNADGSPAGDDFAVNSTTESQHNRPHITALSDGGFAVTWDIDLHQNRGDPHLPHSSALTRVFNADGSAAGTDFAVNSTTDFTLNSSDITGLSDGRFVVAWTKSIPGANGAGAEVRVQLFNADNSPAGDDFSVSTSTDFAHRIPSVTTLSDGRFAVTWYASPEPGSGSSRLAIRARVFNDDGSPVGPDIVIKSAMGGYPNHTDITALSDGRFVVTWTASGLIGDDYFGTSIRARVFNADGSPAGGDFAVDSTTDGVQNHPNITALSDGRFVVTWTDNSQTGGDTSGTAIRAQIFDAGGAVKTLVTTEEIFADQGKLAFMTELALAAYCLDDRENISDHLNDYKQTAEDAFDGLGNHIRLLDNTDLTITNTDETIFGQNGFDDGIYTRNNVAALVGRSADALFLSFRGTNDNEDETGLETQTGLPDSPDEQDWVGNPNHFNLFEDLIREIGRYIDENPEITTIYVTGHGLGAAMVEAFMDTDWVQTLFSGTTMEAITFANPGYSLGLENTDPRTTNFLIDNDPIGGWMDAADIEGDQNTIYHNLITGVDSPDSNNLHDMKLYAQFISFFQDNGIAASQLNSTLHGVNYDSIFSFVYTTWYFDNGELSFSYAIGVRDDTIYGSNTHDIILGGKGADWLYGKSGVDHLDGGRGLDHLFGGEKTDYLYGGTHSDVLKGGKGADYLYGEKGRDLLWGNGGGDHFIFESIEHTNSQNGYSKADRIMDFGIGNAADDIDLSGIDANAGIDGDQAFDFIGSNDFSNIMGELRYFQNRKNTIVAGDVDGDGVADFFIRVAGMHVLEASDFVL